MSGGTLSTEKDPSLLESMFSLKFSVEANAETVAAMEVIVCLMLLLIEMIYTHRRLVCKYCKRF